MARRQQIKEVTFTDRDLPLDGETPPVWAAYKKRSWEAFQSLPYPSADDEAWRRTSLQNLKLDTFQLPDGEVTWDLEEGISEETFVESGEDSRGGRAILTPQGVEVKLSPELADQGVIFTDIKTAAENHPELMERVLGQIVKPEDGKFAALTGAFAEQGIFVYVPKGLRVEKTLHGLTWAPGSGYAHLSHLLIYVDEGASLQYLHESSSPGDLDDQSLTGENWEIYVGQGANLTFVELQTFGEHVWSFAHKKAHVDRDGKITWVMGALGARLIKHFTSYDLIGEGAEGRISGLYFGRGNQHQAFNTQQNHLAPHTYSDLLYKGVLTEASRSVWRGMIYVSPGSQYIDGYQANRNMILSDGARADSIPGLEILNDDVRCTHGSTVGKVDPEQLFYLQARGIPLEEARRLIVYGFFEDIMKRIPFEEVRERLSEEIRERLSRLSKNGR
ncbi:MAG: Fe-S cluster assembly protein SufD [Anaerolineales bacterium]